VVSAQGEVRGAGQLDNPVNKPNDDGPTGGDNKPVDGPVDTPNVDAPQANGLNNQGTDAKPGDSPSPSQD
jgi:hypothetical protein